MPDITFGLFVVKWWVKRCHCSPEASPDESGSRRISRDPATVRGGHGCGGIWRKRCWFLSGSSLPLILVVVTSISEGIYDASRSDSWHTVALPNERDWFR